MFISTWVRFSASDHSNKVFPLHDCFNARLIFYRSGGFLFSFFLFDSMCWDYGLGSLVYVHDIFWLTSKGHCNTEER